MDYEYDLFISYCRGDDTLAWLERQFLPRLKSRLKLELGREPRIFYDKHNLQCGDTWPVELGEALGKSRALLALWSKPFLNSVWCSREMAQMRAREQALALRTPQNQSGVIAISVIHNGPPPETLQDIQFSDIEKFFNPDIKPMTKTAKKFYDKMKVEAEGLAKLIENAPQFDENWPTQSAQQFYDAFHRDIRPSQNARPRYSS